MVLTLQSVTEGVTEQMGLCITDNAPKINKEASRMTLDTPGVAKHLEYTCLQMRPLSHKFCFLPIFFLENQVLYGFR